MLTVTLLGTGGTQPLPERALAALAVSVGGGTVLLDCGEGTQTALRRWGVSAYRLHTVLLTHYHGDHILGLPGLLQTLSSLGRTAPLTVVGPAGLEAVAAPMAALAGPLRRGPQDPGGAAALSRAAGYHCHSGHGRAGRRG